MDVTFAYILIGVATFLGITIGYFAGRSELKNNHPTKFGSHDTVISYYEDIPVNIVDKRGRLRGIQILDEDLDYYDSIGLGKAKDLPITKTVKLMSDFQL